MNKTKITCLIFFAFIHLHGQNTADVIRKTAIEIQDPKDVNQDLYATLKNYKFICLGEMHGTKETAEFLTCLAKTFIANKRPVIAGFEIPDQLMTQFQQQRDSAGLSKTDFFSVSSTDGRASQAWFRAISECNQSGVRFCFFDNSDQNRDSAMFDKLLQCHLSDTSAVIITISGNIHNKIVPFRGNKTMGCYLKDRFGKKVCSINHIYNGGTMYNATARGLKVYTILPTDGIFSSSTTYNSYYLPNIFNIEDYTGFFFTRVVTASLPVSN